MNKFNKYLAYTAVAFIVFCGESLDTPQLLASILVTAVLLLLAGEFRVHHNENKFDSELLANAPIAQQTARDLKIEV